MDPSPEAQDPGSIGDGDGTSMEHTRPGEQTKNYGKIHPFFMGKLTISTGPFSIANC